MTMRDPSRLTTLNRAELRQMGLTTSKVVELFAQAQASTAAEGCECGIEAITPARTAKNGHYRVGVHHAPTCPMHPVQERKRAERDARLLSRVKRFLLRR